MRCSYCGKEYLEEDSDASEANTDTYCSEDCEIAGELRHSEYMEDPED